MVGEYLAEQVRSGLVETHHLGAVAVVSGDGQLVARSGDIDRPFFLRSAAKPFQATVSQEAGADLTSQEMATVCASHRGFPVHIAMVSSILERAGLDESSLRCPESWPLGLESARRALRAGATKPRRIWHNCSGKHAGFLRACVGSGWPTESYLSPDHPLQRRVVDFVSDLAGHPADPVGVDGCGAPVLATTVRSMARLFVSLATDERLTDAFEAMHRYPALVGCNGEGDTEIAIAINGVAKGGAAGCIGVAIAGRLGLAVKSWDGQGMVASLAAVSTLQQLGELTPTAVAALEPISRPVVYGGGVPVGQVESRVELSPT